MAKRAPIQDWRYGALAALIEACARPVPNARSPGRDLRRTVEIEVGDDDVRSLFCQRAGGMVADAWHRP